MKKLIVYALLLVFTLSCANERNLPKRIDRFVSDTVESADYMSISDWELSTEEYETLLDEFFENYDIYTPEQRQQVYAAIGRYNGALVKHGMTDLANELSDFSKEFQSLLDEVPDALNSLIEGFQAGFEQQRP